MTRFRIFRGRHVHRRPGEPAVIHPGAPAASTRPAATWPPPPAAADPAARHRTAIPPPARHGLTAVAVAGGALVLAVPVAAISVPAEQPAAPPAPVLGLIAGDTPASVTRRIATPPDARRDAGLPPVLDVSMLVKAAGLAEAAERAERRVAPKATPRCDPDLDTLGRVAPSTRTAARFLSCLYDEPELGEADGQTVVFVVGGKERGDRIAACALANREELGVDYVLWRDRANDGDGWERVSDLDEDLDADLDADLDRRPRADLLRPRRPGRHPAGRPLPLISPGSAWPGGRPRRGCAGVA